MEFYSDLYTDIQSLNRIDKIKEKLKKNQFLPFIHVITLPLFEDGMLEIYPAYILLQKVYKEMDIQVVGIASGHNEALELVQEITENCMKETGQVDLKKYLKFD